MNTSYIRKTGMALLGVIFAGLVLSATALAQSQDRYMIKLTGREWEQVKEIKYLRAKKQYLVTKMDDTTLNIARGQVVDLRVPTPPGFSGIAKLVKDDDATSATKLENIADKYAWLYWDMKAYEVLIPYYSRQQEYKKVKTACQKLKARFGQVPDAFKKYWWTALLKVGPLNTLKSELKGSIEDGSRYAAASAYLIMGDIHYGDQNLDSSLIDGYFRVVLMFRDIRSVQPEGLYKTWKVLKEKKDRRAEKYRRKLLDEYADSPYADMVG